MPLKVSVLEALPKARKALELVVARERVCDREVEWVPLPEPQKPEWHAAIDGGSSLVSLHDEDIFIVKGWSGWWPGAGESYYASIGPVIPAPEAEYRIPVYREIVEYRVALEAAREAKPGGILLFDGSASTAVKWWRHSQGREQKRLREAVENLERNAGVSMEEFAVEVLKGSDLPVSYNIALRLASNARVGEQLDWIPGVEMLEKLLLFKMVMEEAWSRGALTVFIAKTIRRSKYCRMPRSDVYYLERILPREPGMVEPDEEVSIAVGAPAITGIRDRGGDSGLFREVFPRHYGIRSFYLDRVAVVESYVRFGRGSPILLVGVLYDDKAEAEPFKLLERAVSLVAGLSLNREGYPLPLQIAHKRAAVRPEEETAVRKLLEERRPGRVMLRL